MGYEPALRGAGPSTGVGAQPLGQRRADPGRCPGSRRARRPGPPPPGPHTATTAWAPPPTIRTGAPGPLGQLRADRAPAVGHVVGQAGHRHGIDRRRQRDQHRVGEGDAHQVGQRPAPVALRRRRCRTWTSGGTSLQLAVTPRRQGSQRPHEIWNGTITRSPAATPASSPASATSATNSWPSPNGPGNGTAPRTSQASRSHMATASGRTSASRGPPIAAPSPPATPPAPARGTGAGARRAG